MRLIDGDKLKETIKAHDYELVAHNNTKDRGMFTIGIEQAVDNAPTIDAVPVVRCEHCKYCEKVKVPIWGDSYDCTRLGREEEDVVFVTPNDYCSRGERKDDDRRKEDTSFNQ